MIKKTHPDVDITTMQLDLASFKSVYAFIEAYKATKKPLNILINNAGIMACPQGTTEDGHESQFGVNHLGHFLLTTQLLPLLNASGTKEAPSRVVNVSCAANWLLSSSKGIKFDDLEAKLSYSPYERYGASTTIYASLSPDIKGGEYLADCKVETYAVHEQVMDQNGMETIVG
eukprot:gene25771-32261_t